MEDEIKELRKEIARLRAEVERHNKQFSTQISINTSWEGLYRCLAAQVDGLDDQMTHQRDLNRLTGKTVSEIIEILMKKEDNQHPAQFFGNFLN